MCETVLISSGANFIKFLQKNCMKSRKIWSLAGRRPLDPPLIFSTQLIKHGYSKKLITYCFSYWQLFIFSFKRLEPEIIIIIYLFYFIFKWKTEFFYEFWILNGWLLWFGTDTIILKLNICSGKVLNYWFRNETVVWFECYLWMYLKLILLICIESGGIILWIPAKITMCHFSLCKIFLSVSDIC